MRSGRINSNLVIGLVVGGFVLLGIYENFFASRTARTTASRPSASTTAEVRSRLETMGYALEATHNTLGHSATYSRDFKTAKLKVDLSWLAKDLDSAMFDGFLTGHEYDSEFGNQVLQTLIADIDQVFACREEVVRAYLAGKEQAEGRPRNSGTATTADGWEVNAIEYLQFSSEATEPTQLRYRVLVSRIPGY